MTTPEARLAEHVCDIRRLGKRVVGDVIEIGRLLKECKRIVRHGHWLSWLDRNFGWTEKTAERFMSVHALVGKFDNLSDLEWPVSALYLLAAPSTPADARDAVLDLAASGERMTHAQVKRAIAEAKTAPAKKPKAATAAEETAAPERKGVNAKDPALAEFDAHVLRLLQQTSKAKPERFANTGVDVSKLVQLARFLSEVADAARNDATASAAAMKARHAAGDIAAELERAP